ncbi:hypothetical protein MKZ08_20410 [Viridibacillus sp. FSL R5-0477]|uniref:Integral membrane protein n=1 Tax=Viridibacillus arenosi FSL R5-213 TaxID=1227360 RepID=W4F5K2_9BACL|nr:hypothetical protein [Viridibacillus arenosi]ETT87406.1 hypothetical protein C176_04618 [Viridibacillus arenosi FSL R5-213]OMC91324.1 hypothetical protein BK137_09615 [Viridibacillus arenosi]
MIYSIIVFIHVISAILSIGPFFVLLPMLKKMRTTDNHHALEAYVGTFSTAIRIVKHAGHVLVTTGLLAMWLGGWNMLTSWIVMTFAVMISSIVFLASAFKPTIRTFNTPEFDQQQFINKLVKSVWIYIVLLLIMLWFMVAKPILW